MFNVLNHHAFTSRSLKAKHKLATGKRHRQARQALFCEPLESRLLLATAPLGDQFVVADTLGFTATPAAIAVHTDGSFVTAWESFEEDGSGFGVFAQRFDAGGAEIDAVPFLVNTTTAREQSAPAIAVDAAGNLLVVWQSKGQDHGDTFGIYGQWYDSDGATYGGEFRINTTTAGDQKAPSVAIDGNGDAIIVWQSVGAESLTDTETDDWGVYYARLDGAGDTTPSVDVLVNDAIAGNQQNPMVAASANGNFVIAWEAIDPLGGDDASLDIYAKVFNSAGSQVTLGEQLVNSDQLRDQVTPQVAVDADGDFAIVWVGGGIPGSGSDVFAQRFNQSGIRQGQQFRVNDTTLASQVGGVASMDAAGNFVVAWQSVHQDGFSEGIYARAYDATGAILVGETLVNTVTEGPQSLPSIGMNASGRAVATWHSKNEEHQSALFAQRFNLTATTPFLSKVGGEVELASLVELEGSKAGAAMDHQNRTVVVFESYDEDGDAMGVYAQMLDEFGDPIGDRFLVNTGVTAGNQSAPAVARAPDGRFVIARQSKDQDSDGYGIYAQLYTAAGAPLGTAFQVNTTTVGNQMTPAVAMGEDGRFVVVWQGDDGLEEGVVDGTTDIFAQRFNADGTPTGSEFQVNQFEGTDQNMPAVTMNGAGQFAIAWVSSHPSLDVVEGEEATDTEKSIFVQWYDADGVSTGPEVIAHVYVKDAQEAPQIGMDAEGHFVVAWQSINQESADPDGGTWGVFGRQFNNQKVPLTTAEFQINEQTAGLQRLVGLGVDADGNFVVAYESTVPENTDGISTDIYRREFFPDGSPNGSENVVNTWAGGPQVLPVIARASTGNYGIFWSGQGFSHIDGVHGRLYDVNLLDDPGTPSRVPIGDQFLVSPTLGFEFSSPAIAVHDDGTFTIAFESFEEDTSGFGIFTERFNANGTAVPGSRVQVNTTVLDDQSDPAIASDGGGNVLIVWQSKDSSGYGIFGRWHQGGTFGDEFQLNSTLIGDQTNPDVAIDEAGRVIVAWESTGQVSGNGVEVVYVTLDSVGDVTPSTEQLANVSTTGDQLAPRVAASARDAVGGNNQFVIAWQGPGLAIEGEEVTEATVDIFARRLDSTGAPIGGEFVVNSTGEHDQILPDLGMDAAGNVAFVWQAEGQQGSGSDVYARRMTAAGILLGVDELVNTTTTRPQRLPSVAMDAAGNYLVSWQSQHQDGYSWGIYRQGFDTSGARVGEEVIVNHRVEGPQTAPTVASNSDGDGIVAWLGNSATHQPSIFAHAFDLPATEVEGEILLTSYVGLEDSAPAAAMNALRESVVVWESYAEVEDGSSGLGVFGQLLDAQGLPIGGRFLVNENRVLGNQGAPAVARAPSGEFVVAWQSEVADGSYDIFARRYSADGTPNGAIFQVNTTTTGDQKAPAVAIGPDGRFVIAWQSDGPDGSTDIMAQRYLPDGGINGSAFRVNNKTALDQYDPSITMNSSGEFVIAWVSNHPSADPATMDDDSEKSIFVQWFSAKGVAAPGDEVLVHRYVKDAQEAPAIGIDVTGRFVVAWQSINQDGNSWGVFARRFNADKTPIDRREITVNQTRMGPQRFAGLGVDQYGRFVISWQSNERAELTDTGSGGGGGGGEPGTPEGSSWDLYSRQYSFDGSPEGGEIFVNTWQMGPQILPVVAQASGGDFGIFWLGQGPDHIEGVNGRLYEAIVSVGTVNFDVAGYVVNETTAEATITVTRTGGSLGAFAVNYAAVGGTATAGADFEATSGMLNFADGQLSQTFTVTIYDDMIVEGNETILLSLTNATGDAALGINSSATLTIQDNEAPTVVFYTIANGDTLLELDPADPTNIVRTLPLANLDLDNGETIVAIDIKPSIIAIYGLAVEGTTAQLVTINPRNGAVVRVGSTFIVSGTDFGFDFDPVNGQIRVVSDNGINLSINPSTGAVTTQTPLNPGTPDVVAAAYTNSFQGAGSTTLYVIDSTTDTLSIQQGSTGTLVTVGALGIDASSVTSFEISPFNNQAFAVTMLEGDTDAGLYSIDLATGAASLICAAPVGGEITGLTSFTINDQNFTADQRFVNQLYIDALGRLPDAGGSAHWVNALDLGASREAVAEAVITSNEAIRLRINDLYQLFLGRNADAGGLNYWSSVIVNGGTYVQVAAAVLGSNEYFALNGGTNTSFVTALYLDVLQREADAEGLAYFVSRLDAGASREAVAHALLESGESATLQVNLLYDLYLDEDGPTDQLDEFVDDLLEGARLEDIAVAIAASDEYYAQFSI